MRKIAERIPARAVKPPTARSITGRVSVEPPLLCTPDPARDGRPRVTTSIGAAQLRDLTGTPEQLLAAADSALYDAKDGGRDQVEAAEPVTA